MMSVQPVVQAQYDTVELRTGRLYKIRRSEARLVGEEDGMVQVAKCYCRSHDVITTADAELQRRPSFVFPAHFFSDLESLIGRELEGRVYANTEERRVQFYLDLKEHAGFQVEEGDRSLLSPWYDDNVLKE